MPHPFDNFVILVIKMIAIGHDELSKKDAVGNSINCPNCGDAHEIEYGDEVMPDGTKKPSKLLAFYKCGNKTYLAGIAGKVI